MIHGAETILSVTDLEKKNSFMFSLDDSGFLASKCLTGEHCVSGFCIEPLKDSQNTIKEPLRVLNDLRMYLKKLGH